MPEVPLTMVAKISETKKSTNIYMANEAAVYLALRIIQEAQFEAGVRIVILNKDTSPDAQVYPYAVDRIRPAKKRRKTSKK
jgi:hypothetical protein